MIPIAINGWRGFFIVFGTCAVLLMMRNLKLVLMVLTMKTRPRAVQMDLNKRIIKAASLFAGQMLSFLLCLLLRRHLMKLFPLIFRNITRSYVNCLISSRILWIKNRNLMWL